MTINLLDDQSPWTKGAIPPPMDKCKYNKRPLRSSILMSRELEKMLKHDHQKFIIFNKKKCNVFI